MHISKKLFAIPLSVTITNAFSFLSVFNNAYSRPVSLGLLSLSTLPLSRSFVSTKMQSNVEENSNIVNISGQNVEIEDTIDPEYPGTATRRMLNIRARVRSLTTEELSLDWETVRRKLLWCGGLRDLPHNVPGQGYTGHCFNDFNHVDLTAMRMPNVHNENQGRVAGIHRHNPLGRGILIASTDQDVLGEGGSWTTCMMGCEQTPPQDVAHIQFQARIAFKLVWVPPLFDRFVLVDDDGDLLNQGRPTGNLPHIMERQENYMIVRHSKYSRVADALAVSSSHSNATDHFNPAA